MSFGVYVHIPYCIQRCRYCDFTTFEQNSIMPPSDYLNLIVLEIQSRSRALQPLELESIYFGGGTPSLFPPEYICKILDTLDACGLRRVNSTEVTIEINPATINLDKLRLYQSMGVNRFSLGVQTFSDDLLKVCGREHNSAQTHESLSLLSGYTSNFNLDILYGLPGQSLPQLEKDLNLALQYKPQHVSAYCLTLNQGHPMNQNRPSDEIQMKMLDHISSQLEQHQIHQYEISNFSKTNFESRHNLLYWKNHSYWGLGLSAHSSLPSTNIFRKGGVRFWNPKDFNTYTNQVREASQTNKVALPYEYLPTTQYEVLEPWESLTDFCHISLRLREGLSEDALRYGFGDSAVELVRNRLMTSLQKGYVTQTNFCWTLTSEGQKLSNQVFYDTTFLREDFPL